MLLPVAALLTIANSAEWPINKGIECLVLREDQIFAYSVGTGSANDAFYSQDGGYSWHTSNDYDRSECPSLKDSEISDPYNPNIHFRFTSPSIIEISKDGSITWQEDFLIDPIGEVEEIIIRKTHDRSIVIENRPLDALIDPINGNLLLAMGHRGLLMREADGTWDWIAVGTYEYMAKTRPTDIRLLIDGQILLTGSFLLLGIFTTLTRLNNKPSSYILLIISWSMWFFTTLISSPVNAAPDGAGQAFVYNSTSYLVFWGCANLVLGASFFLGTFSIWRLFQDHREKLWRSLMASCIGAVLFLIPFILWAYRLIPHFRVAAILGCSLPFVSLAIGDQWDNLRQETHNSIGHGKQEEERFVADNQG